MSTADPDDYDRVVMDAEPLVAYFLDERGAETTERFLLAVEEGSIGGYVSDVTLAEVFYVCARAADRDTADEYVDSITANGFETSVSDETWWGAGSIKIDHTIAIGDAFALSTARAADATHETDDVVLLVGADDDFDPFVGSDRGGRPDVVRFRKDAD